MNYTYILECEDGSYYTGWTNNLGKRFAAHKNGTGAKYTRAHKPARIAYYETYESNREAMQREAAVKKLSHSEKKELVDTFKTPD